MVRIYGFLVLNNLLSHIPYNISNLYILKYTIYLISNNHVTTSISTLSNAFNPLIHLLVSWGYVIKNLLVYLLTYLSF